MEISNKTIVIVDPGLFLSRSDFAKTNQGQTLDELGFTNFLTEIPTTSHRDYVIYNQDGNMLGEFVIDHSRVGVYLLEEVLKYNPNFEEERQKAPWIATLIYHFTGSVFISKDKYQPQPIQIFGTGTTNFYTRPMGC